jgi:hypothetical protein
MADGAAGHGDGLDTVKFVAQPLSLFPFEEFGKQHGFANSKVHHGILARIDAGFFIISGLG